MCISTHRMMNNGGLHTHEAIPPTIVTALANTHISPDHTNNTSPRSTTTNPTTPTTTILTTPTTTNPTTPTTTTTATIGSSVITHSSSDPPNNTITPAITTSPTTHSSQDYTIASTPIKPTSNVTSTSIPTTPTIPHNPTYPTSPTITHNTTYPPTSPPTITHLSPDYTNNINTPPSSSTSHRYRTIADSSSSITPHYDIKSINSELLVRRDQRRTKRSLSCSSLEHNEQVSKGLYKGASIPEHEPQRLAALQRMNILDTPNDENFDRIANLGRSIFGTKMAFISLVDEHRQWFKSAVGLDTKSICRNEALCSFTIQANSVLVVPDTLLDDRFKTNPLVIKPPNIRFYAGAPLKSATGFNVGTFSVVDDVPHNDWNDVKQQQLIDLSCIVVREMELARQNLANTKINARADILAAMTNQTIELNTLEELYEINCLRIAEILDVDYVQILEFSEDKQHFIMRSGFGWNSAKNSVRDFRTLVNTIFPHLSTPTLAQHGDCVGTYVIDNIDEILSQNPPSSPGVLQMHSVKTGICSILYHRDKPFGMIGVFDEQPHAWLDEDISFLTNCARSLSVLIERTQHSLEVAHERQRVDELLCTILPPRISQRLKTSEAPIADAHSSVTILFADIVNFTQVSQLVTPKELVSFLNKVFSSFDIETLTRGLEKIKIIGDCYMVAGGLFSHETDHAEAVVELACDLLTALDQLLKEEYADHPHFANISVRIGINTGPVVAGVIGLDRFLYDVWGDAVNTASRLEATGLPGHIHISEATMYSIPHQEKFIFEERGSIYLKGKGEMQTLFVRRKNTGESAR